LWSRPAVVYEPLGKAAVLRVDVGDQLGQRAAGTLDRGA
jgi:hypothetical protein